MWVSEVKFQHTKECPSFMELEHLHPGVVTLSWLHEPRTPETGSAELIAVPSKGFLS